MIRSAAFGQLENERYVEYARDIRTAGLEIAVLVDELDDFTRLRDGRYAPRPADVDLSALLESCMARVRAQASAARVLVRSAISEALPRVHADRASLGQALLNLLASAIDQTPIGSSVILSAQTDEDVNVAIHGFPPLMPVTALAQDSYVSAEWRQTQCSVHRFAGQIRCTRFRQRVACRHGYHRRLLAHVEGAIEVLARVLA